MKRILLTFLALAIPANGAIAANPQGVPASAKKLTAAGIKSLYQGARATYDNRQQGVRGEIFYNLTAGYAIGNFEFGNGNTGIFKGTIRVLGNKFCYKSAVDPEVCTDVYLDGKTYYEVDANNKIVSVDKLLPNPPPAPNKKLTPAQVLALVKGKRVFVTVHDFGQPLVADLKWDVTKKVVTGKYFLGGKEGTANSKFVVDRDKICQQDSAGKKVCYTYYPTDNGFIEVNSSGAVHGVSTLQ
jgi:hypothetical protein